MLEMHPCIYEETSQRQLSGHLKAFLFLGFWQFIDQFGRNLSRTSEWYPFPLSDFLTCSTYFDIWCEVHISYSPLQRGEVPLYSSLRRFPIIRVTLHRWQHRGGQVK